MAKIKKVTIENFRAYEGSHEFSFINKDGVANLVVIYAPNGYGKTSFFDAVEWAFSNKIRRFENGVLRQELESKDFASGDQIILTNRAGYYNGGKGEVTILTDEDKVIKRTVVPRQIPNTDIKNDYRDVPLLGNYSQQEINLFTENNMLTQDQIDSFLRFKSPEEKFEALREFWPEGSEASAVFSSLTRYSRILKSKAQGLQARINEIQLEIDQNINSEDNFSKIDTWIRQFNNETVSKVNFPLISHNINQEVYKGIIQTNETYKLIIEGKVADSGNVVIKLNVLNESFKTYLARGSEIRDIQASRLSFQRNAASLERIRVLRENNAARNPVLNRMYAEQSVWQRSIALWPLYIEDKLQVQNLQNQTYQCLQDIDTKTEERSFLAAEINDINAERSRFVEELANEQLIASRIEVNLKQINKLRLDISDGISHQQYSEACIAQTIADNGPVYQQRQLLVEIINEEEYASYETPDIVASEHLMMLPVRRKNLRDMSSEIQEMNLEIERKSSFNENLNRLVKWATQQVQEQQLTSCPLCRTEFDQVGELVSAIAADNTDLVMVTQLEQELEDFYLILSYLREEVTESESFLYQFFNDEYNPINRQIVSVERSIEEFESAIRKAGSSIDHNHIVINELFAQITPNQDIADYDEIDFDTYRVNNKENLDNITRLIREEDEKLSVKTNKLKEINNVLLVLQNTITNNRNKTSLIQAKETYIEFTELLAEHLDLESADFELSYLQQQLFGISVMISAEEELIWVQNKNIGDLQKELQEAGNGLSEVQVKQHLAELERNLNTLAFENANFEANYKALINEQTISQSSIERQLDRYNKQHEELIRLRKRLDAFGLDLAIIESDVIRNELQGELSRINGENNKIHNALSRIEHSREKVGEFITKGIDEYFNKDVINQIYGKIEPHPKLTEIDIRAESSGKLPRLSIKAKSDSEELAPGLFLSTGQVNVLSLSIFIARAYEMGNGNFNSIFMDDPVQNMSDINVLSFIDLLRILIMDQDKQVMISTHDEKFFRLLKNKLPSGFFKSKYIELSTYGTLKMI